jgi:hypothetical protein
MKTPKEILAKHAEDAVAAAMEFRGRGFEGQRLTDAAIAWCDHFSGRPGVLGAKPFGAENDAAVWSVLAAAFEAQPPLADWVAAAREEREAAAGDATYSYNWSLMNLLLVLWEHRGSVAALRHVAETWASLQSCADRFEAARGLAAYPLLAYGLIGPLEYRATSLPCFGCTKHPRPVGDDGAPHLWLLYRRRTMGCEPHGLDDEVLERIPAGALVEEPGLTAVMMLWLNGELEPPTTLGPQLLAAISGRARGPTWRNAIGLLCGYPDDRSHEHAVDAITRMVAQARDPAREWRELFEGAAGMLRYGLFTGARWGRKIRREKLLPLARAFLDRGVWPAGAWTSALRPRLGAAPPESDGDVGERQREVLAEGLLAIAKDDAEPEWRRRLALRAIGELRPGGDGSHARALSKVHGPATVTAEARRVQRRLRERTDRVDAELAIEDACALFFGEAPALAAASG